MKAKIIPYFILFILNCSLTSTAHAQVLTKKRGKFYYDNQVYSKKGIAYVFSLSEKAEPHYKRAMRNINTANRMRNGALISLGLGALAYWRSEHANSSEKRYGWKLVTVALSTFSAVSTLICIKEYSLSKHSFNRALNEFNLEKGYLAPNLTSQTSFAITQNGIGIVYAF